MARADAPKQLAVAEAAEQKAAALAAQMVECFDAAYASFATAAEQLLSNDRPGEASDILLDMEAAVMYKVLYTYEPAVVNAAKQTYIQRLAAFYDRCQELRPAASRDPEQLLSLETAALRCSLCLLISDVADEADQHLALAASMRRGGSRGEMAVAVFAYDYQLGGHTTTAPVGIELKTGEHGINTITAQRGFVSVGSEYLMGIADSFSLLAELAAAAQGYGTRSPTTDELALRIADAIADASG